MIRAFIAVELDRELRAAIAEAQRWLKEQVRKELGHQAADVRVQWVRPEAIHLTLKFLGNVEETGLPTITAAMEQAVAGRKRLSLHVGEGGAFPHVRAPRVLWLGLAGQVEELVGLAGALEAALQVHGFQPEPRPFQPHLTLARIKEGSRRLGPALERIGPLAQSGTLGTLTVGSLSLMKSDLHPSGAVYTRLYEAKLGVEGDSG